jgi:glycosyltransferase involved in cell wall biosynthesis
MILRSGSSYSSAEDPGCHPILNQPGTLDRPLAASLVGQSDSMLSAHLFCGSILLSSHDSRFLDSLVQSPLEFTVAIRTYDAGPRLVEILERLRNQAGVDDRRWEILVVDNNSSDDSRDRVMALQADWDRPWPLRYCLEPRQGAIFARQRAIREAKGHWVGFLDDDNFPAPDWVAESIAFGEVHPEAGAYSSRIAGEFERTPPPGFDRIAQFLPVIERDEVICFTQGSYGRKLVLPPGAGLVVRRSAWLTAVPEELRLSGPVGKSLVAKGEDLEGLSYIKQQGWEIWFNPKMQISHRILAHRLERSYLLSFFQGIGLGRHWTRMLGYQPRLRPLMTLLYGLSDGLKLVRHGLYYSLKRRLTGQSDLVADCEWQLLWSSWLSPFFHWRRLWNESRSKTASPLVSREPSQAASPAASQALLNVPLRGTAPLAHDGLDSHPLDSQILDSHP